MIRKKHRSKPSKKEAMMKSRSLGVRLSRAVFVFIKKHSKKVAKSLLLSSSFQKSCKIAFIGFIAASSLYGVFHLISRTVAEEVVISRSEITARIGELTTVPSEEPLEVVRVQDAETLEKQNSFYSTLKEGDYIVVYKNMLITYDLRNNVILGKKILE